MPFVRFPLLLVFDSYATSNEHRSRSDSFSLSYFIQNPRKYRRQSNDWWLSDADMRTRCTSCRSGSIVWQWWWWGWKRKVSRFAVLCSFGMLYSEVRVEFLSFPLDVGAEKEKGFYWLTIENGLTCVRVCSVYILLGFISFFLWEWTIRSISVKNRCLLCTSARSSHVFSWLNFHLYS